MKSRFFAPALGVLCALLAVLTVMAAGVSARAATPLEKTQALHDRVTSERGNLDTLQQQADALRRSITGLQSQIASEQTTAQELAVQLQQVSVLDGGTALHGPGVLVTLSDAPKERIEQAGAFYDINWFLVHDHDLLTVINLLRDAGAEAIAVNGVRLQADTAVHCAGPAIYVRDISLTPPFLIQAIGDSAKLSDAILRADNGEPSAIFEELKLFGIVFTVEKKEDIMIPASTTTDAARRASHNR